MKTFDATWIGDDDPGAQIITVGGVRFIKGEATKVPADHPMAETLKSNPLFAMGADEDEPVDAGEDEELKAVRSELDGRGIKYRANASLETLRDTLAKAG